MDVSIKYNLLLLSIYKSYILHAIASTVQFRLLLAQISVLFSR